MQLCTYSTAEERAHTLECTTSDVSDAVVWQEHQRTHDGLPPNLSFTRKACKIGLISGVCSPNLEHLSHAAWVVV